MKQLFFFLLCCLILSCGNPGAKDRVNLPIVVGMPADSHLQVQTRTSMNLCIKALYAQYVGDSEQQIGNREWIGIASTVAPPDPFDPAKPFDPSFSSSVSVPFGDVHIKIGGWAFYADFFTSECQEAPDSFLPISGFDAVTVTSEMDPTEPIGISAYIGNYWLYVVDPNGSNPLTASTKFVQLKARWPGEYDCGNAEFSLEFDGMPTGSERWKLNSQSTLEKDVARTIYAGSVIPGHEYTLYVSCGDRSYSTVKTPTSPFSDATNGPGDVVDMGDLE